MQMRSEYLFQHKVGIGTNIHRRISSYYDSRNVVGTMLWKRINRNDP